MGYHSDDADSLHTVFQWSDQRDQQETLLTVVHKTKSHHRNGCGHEQSLHLPAREGCHGARGAQRDRDSLAGFLQPRREQRFGHNITLSLGKLPDLVEERIILERSGATALA